MATSNMKLMGAFRMTLWRAQAFSQCTRIFAKIDSVLPPGSSMAVSNINLIWALVYSYMKHKPWRAAAVAKTASTHTF